MTTTNTEAAINAFVRYKAEIDDMLRQLQALSDDHFNVSPDDVHWGHVGALADQAEQLRRAIGR